MERPKATSLQRKLLTLGLTGAIALGGVGLLSGCDNNSEQPSTPPATAPETPGTPTGETTEAPFGEVPDDIEGENPELNGHTQEEYDDMQEIAEARAQRLLDEGHASSITGIRIFPDPAPNGYRINFINAETGEPQMLDWNP